MGANIVLPKPHSGQAEVYRSTAQYRVLSCGRRWGKTNLMQTEAVRRAIKRAQPVGWFAPNYKYLGEPYRELCLKLTPIIVAKNHERFITLANGVRIDFWTLEDENSGRGFKYGLAIVDEAGMVKNLGERFDNAIQPTLTDLDGDAIFGGTPKGRNYFFTLFMRGIEGIPGWESFQKPTSTNPFLPPARYDPEILLAQGYPERSYQQEYLAEFLDDAGGVFIGVDAVIDKGRSQNEAPLPGVRYFCGIDLAQSQDFTVISIFDQGGRQVYFDRFQRLSWELTIQRLIIAISEYGATGFVDATGVGAPIYEALVAAGVDIMPFQFTAQSKGGLIERAVATVQRKDIRLMDILIQTDELKAYEYEVTKSGNVRMNAPEGMHDDCVIAVALAINAMAVPKFNVFT